MKRLPDSLDDLLPAQAQALRNLGLTDEESFRFLRGEIVVYERRLSNQSELIGVIQAEADFIRSGLIYIKDTSGGGALELARFRTRSFAVARAFGYSVVELVGYGLINTKLEKVIKGRGFVKTTALIPVELGGGETDVWVKRLSIPTR
jgi:hypothetical protein